MLYPRPLALVIALLTVLLTGVQLHADGNISGMVYGKQTGQPIDLATVVLLDPETALPLQLAAMTDENGAFAIRSVPAGRYILRVSCIGSVTQERPVEVADTDVNVGRIALADDVKLLDEVVVTGQRSQMSVSADRRLYNVSANIASKGATAEELLAAVPSVNVSSDGDISLRGNSDVMVWINGKEMGMTADTRAQLLRQIPADNVESIEVMTNPSSKHGTEGTAGIINIRLKEDSRHGYYGSADAGIDSRGSATLNASVNYNEGKFETFAGLGLKSSHTPGGVTSSRIYEQGEYLDSHGRSTGNENSMFLRLGTNFRADDNNMLYLSAIGTLGHKFGHSNTTHLSDLPGMWVRNDNHSYESGNTGGANVLLGYRHIFRPDHRLDMNVSYNIWQGSDRNRISETETAADGLEAVMRRNQYQNVRIRNVEAAIDYTVDLQEWLTLESGFKGNYNHENSPASYAAIAESGEEQPLNNLYNRFKYNTDISALYLNLSGKHGPLSYSAGLRGEAWQISTRSLGYGQTDSEVPAFRRNRFSLFPSASLSWSVNKVNELALSYSRRIHRPYGPQLNTFENISDPSEVHLGNPHIMPEYSNAVEVTYTGRWSDHTLSVSGYLRSNTDMISHVSFLAPMVSDPTVNTMYYGHANVGNMVNTGMEIISHNTLFKRLSLTTTVNLYNSHLKGWVTDYPLRDSYYQIRGRAQDRVVLDLRLMASVRLPWDMTLQATGRYSSRSVIAQGTLEPDGDLEAGLRKNIGAWGISLMCKDILKTKRSHNILYGNGYTQSVDKWNGGRTLRLTVSYTFGKTHDHDHDHDLHNDVDTGGYGEEHSHGHGH